LEELRAVEKQTALQFITDWKKGRKQKTENKKFKIDRQISKYGSNLLQSGSWINLVKLGFSSSTLVHSKLVNCNNKFVHFQSISEKATKESEYKATLL
jgi:GTPase involved in cell partitioning and DNA repair